MSNVNIRLFGKFEITADGELALTQLDHARKTHLFVQYLILKRGERVPHEELLNALSSDKESASPANAMRTLLHRYRAMIQQSGIAELQDSVLTTRGYYQWNPALPCKVDIYEFERLVALASDTRLPNQARVEHCMQVLDLYSAPLLGGRAEEPWLIQWCIYYHERYLACMLILIDLLKQQEDYEAVVRVCRRILQVELFDERVHMELALALSHTGQKHETMSQYCFMGGRANWKSSVQNGEDLQAVYRQLLDADSQMDEAIDAIRAELESQSLEPGAFICDYKIFSEIYQIQQRMIARTNTTTFLAICGITSIDGGLPDSLLLDHAMQELMTLLRANLRQGDTISRCGVSQCAVLLSAVTYEDGKAVLERIKKTFQQKTSPSLLLSSKLRPLTGLGAQTPGMEKPKRDKSTALN